MTPIKNSPERDALPPSDDYSAGCLPLAGLILASWTGIALIAWRLL